MQHAKPLPALTASPICVPVLVLAAPVPIQFPANMPGGKQQETAQVPGFLPPHWKSGMEPLAPSFGLAQARSW